MRQGVALGAILASLIAAQASAQQTVAPPPAAAADASVSFLAPPAGPDNPLLRKSRDYQGVPLANWMFYPEFIASAIYNDNLALSPVAPRAAGGLRLHPDVYGLADSGLAETRVYGALDASLYPGSPRDNQLDGTLGVSQTYRPTPDLTIKAEGRLDRLGGFADGGDVLAPNGQTASLVAPSQSNRGEASAGLIKTFGRLFAGASVSLSAINYDALATSLGTLSQSYRDGEAATLTQRLGYWVSPLLYGYGETAENWRNYSNRALRSNGYRAVAGLGSDRIGLFRGEIFAGYQIQEYGAPLPGSASSPVVGGKLFYYPTRALTLDATLDESFTDSANPTPGNPRGDPQRDLSASFDAVYQLHQQWSFLTNLRFDHAAAIGAPRVDETYAASTQLNYELRRDIDMTLTYRYLRNNSTALGGGYLDNIASLGARYRF